MEIYGKLYGEMVCDHGVGGWNVGPHEGPVYPPVQTAVLHCIHRHLVRLADYCPNQSGSKPRLAS